MWSGTVFQSFFTVPFAQSGEQKKAVKAVIGVNCILPHGVQGVLTQTVPSTNHHQHCICQPNFTCTVTHIHFTLPIQSPACPQVHMLFFFFLRSLLLQEGTELCAVT